MEVEEEIWKDVTGYNGRYKISNKGRLMSLVRPNVIIKYGKLNSDGYNCTSLMIGGVRKFYTVHRLVAIHFIENPNNYEIVNHLNGIKTDNRAENLEWCTTQQNTEHAVKNNLLPFGENNHRSKLTKQIVLEIRRKYIPTLYTQRMLAKEFNISRSAINHVIHKRVWTRV